MTIKSTLVRVGVVAALTALSGCEAEIEAVETSKEDIKPIDASPELGAKAIAPDVALCDSGKSYVGFGGAQLTQDRKEADVGLERARAKPFTALQTEYPRVLGTTPVLLAESESTFGLTPPRWYPKVDPNAVSLYQAYRIAFQGCLTVTATAPQYNQLPTIDSARTECTGWAKKFWSRSAMGPEIEACTNVIGMYANSESNLRRRWAHGCASVLTASDFLTF